MINEYYANIKGYEDLYQISNYGTIKSVTHYIIDEKGNQRLMKGKILKQTLDRKNGYLSVSLMKKGKKRTFRIHKLVANTFIPNPDKLPQVNHIDGNKENNYVGNLEWCSCKDNIQHAWKNKLNYVSEKHRQVASETMKKRWENYRKNKELSENE